jgi:AbrB family looped-hinge helix DNA binding protein
MAVDLVKMSEKGQLVVPQEIRDLQNLAAGERFVAFPVQDGVLFKKVDIPLPNFESLSKEIAAQFKRNKVKKSDITEAVEWARKS